MAMISDARRAEAVVERHVSVDRVPYLVGGVAAVLLITIMLMLVGDRIPGAVVLVVLGLLAAAGVAALVGLLFGVVRLGGRSAGQAVAEALLREREGGVLVARRDGEVIYATRPYADLLGHGASGASVTAPPLALDAGGEGGAALARLADAARRGDPAAEEIRDADGRWLRVTTRPVALSDRLDDLVAWEVDDVTGDRRRQEAVFLAAQDAVDYLDAAPVGIAAVRADGVLVHVNATLAHWLGVDLTGFRREEMRLADFIAGEGAMLLSSARRGPDGLARVDLDMVGAGGASLPARLLLGERPGGGRLMVALDRRTDAHGAAGVGDDAEARFNRFFNDAPVAIASLDAEGRVARANGAFARLVGRHDIGGRTLPALLPGIEAGPIERAVAQARDARAEAEGIDVSMPTAVPGELRHLRLHVVALAREADGEREGDAAAESVIVYAVDQTESRGIEAAYAQAQKMEAVGELAGGMAHDINNMLGIVMMSADELLTSHPANDPSNPRIREIKTTAGRAAAMVKHLLAYSRRQTMRPELFDLSDTLADMDVLLRQLARKVPLHVEPGSGLWPVKADPAQIEQVLSNLVRNAEHATPADGSITVSARNVPAAEAAQMPYRGLVAQDLVMIEVSDTGHGMDEATRARVFDPFFTTKGVNEGTGLGLAMVYGTIKQSHGFVFVDSEVGRGTRFRILLPRHQITDEERARAAAEAAKKAAKPKRDITGTGTILLVEDETLLRATSLRALRGKGYEVHEAVDGLDALDVLEELDGEVDLIVSDVVMPEMNGPTLLREVRAKYGDRHGFIFVSGNAQSAFASDLPEDAEFTFVPKPYELSELAAAVKDVLTA